MILAETFTRPANNRRELFLTLDLAGKATRLREFPLGPLPLSGVAIDTTSAIMAESPQAAVRVVRLSDGGEARELVPARGGESSGLLLSLDGQWLTLRRAETPPGGQPAHVLELARVDGSVHRTVPIPFVPAPGINPRVVAGGHDLVVLEGRRPGPDAETGAYLVSAGTRAVRTLFTYSAQSPQPELAISPDGQQLLYLVWEAVPPSLRTLDLTPAARR